MIKLWAFHSIMISRFAAIRMWRWFICEFSMMMMVLSSPFNKYVDSIVYWVVILGEVIDWIFRDCFYTLFDGYTIQECHHTCNYGSEGNYKLLLFSYNRRCTSLPRKLMVLSCVQLHEPFVGWLEKLGYQYGKFLRDLNRIGLEGTCMFNKIKRHSCKVYKFRCNKMTQWVLLWLCWVRLGLSFEMSHYMKGMAEHKDYNLVDFNLDNVHEGCSCGCPMNIVKRSMDLGSHVMPSCCFTALPPTLALSSSSDDYRDRYTNADSDFSLGTYEFGMDNCATHHICGDKNLFMSMSDLPNDVHVNGISGSSMAKGIGTVRFHIMDTEGHDHLIVLDNVIYLPGAAKNLISISQWAKDKGDNAGIMSRGTFSYFMWNDDAHQTVIGHPPDCPIPLMSVTTPGENRFSAFLASQSASLIDNDNTSMISSDLNRDTTVDQQPAEVPSTSNLNKLLEPGTTVRSFLNGVSRVSIVTHAFRSAASNVPKYKIRHLNESSEIEVDDEALTEISPEPADIPTSVKDVDTKLLEQTLPEEHVKRLWDGDLDDTVPEADRVTLYWHHRLRHAPLVTLRRLSIRGILPKCIQNVVKMPLCAACAFATAHRRNWRVKGKAPDGIRQQSHTKPGDGTSCDHLISKQPGLMPQSTGILTHARFWGSVIYVDHFSDFIYSHLIQGTTSADTLNSKHGYEREAAAHGVKVKSYHADNLRFNDNNFKGSCIKANQQITYCGVGAHHQNAVVESKVKELSYGARTVLLHAKRKWPSVITTILWPFA